MAEKSKSSMDHHPLVTVICLCFNHKPFVADAIKSVLSQEYPNVELIVVDDASTDGSGEVIRQVCEEHTINYILNAENMGNCRAFNHAYQESKGEFIIDLAADDMLLPNRISVGVDELNEKGPGFSVHYSNAMIIDQNDQVLGLHTETTRTIDPNLPMPEGDVFSEVLARYFICPPTLMARKQVFDELKGYDEDLSFEDFDFLVRSSRQFQFCYSPEVLVKRRIVKGSKSKGQYKKGSKDLWSVLAVCKKALGMVRNKEERDALNQRLEYECRQVIIHKEPEIVTEYLNLMKENGMSWLIRILYRIMGDVYPKVFG